MASTSPQAPRRNTLLIILDGFGLNPSKKNNAVVEANTPNLDSYFSQFDHTALQASGAAVGLPDGQMGNSEVGHITIGCGCIFKQDLVRVSDSIDDGELFDNTALVNAIELAKANQRPLHLLGLVSDGGVHSHVNHLLALLDMCASHGVKPMVHAITDGRDTAPNVAQQYLSRVQSKLDEVGGAFATVVGRYYAMDRDNRWDRTELAWRAFTLADGETADSADAAVQAAYAADENDEFIKPRIIAGGETMQANDAVVFFNFRNDRPRQMGHALADETFTHFSREGEPVMALTTMTHYDSTLSAEVAFAPQRPETNIASVVAQAGLKQLHISETEKYAHVTFFLNGGREQPYDGETQVVIDSPKVATYDLAPEMSAKALADKTIEALNTQDYGFVVMNFPNGDMVGHTAVADAVIQAVETLDEEVGRVLDAALLNEYSVILTADHGNCDEYIDPVTGKPNPQHTVYPVPCMVIDSARWSLLTGGGLSNLAGTVLQLMGLEKPAAIEGRSLLLEELASSDSAPSAYT